MQVDDLRGRPLQGHGLGIAANHHEAPVLDRHGTGLGFLAVNGVQASVVQNEIGGGVGHGFTPCKQRADPGAYGSCRKALQYTSAIDAVVVVRWAHGSASRKRIEGQSVGV